MKWCKNIFLILFTVLFLLLPFLHTETVYAEKIAQGYVTDTEGKRCGTLYWTLDSDGTFVVTGTGPGACYRPYGIEGFDQLCPWNAYRDKIKKVVFRCTFTGASLYHYEYGASINSWFVNCVNLESYSDIPSGVTDMSATFLGCSNLKECGKIPDSVKVMHYTFALCTSMVVPPQLPKGLMDYCYPRYKDEIVHEPAFGLGLTFTGCTSLVTTPSFDSCTGINALVGTFADCTSLVTIQNLPPNINYLFNSFTNCPSVRGVFSSQAEKVVLEGASFAGLAQDDDYLLFVKAKDATLFEKIKTQAGGNFRGYVWNDAFTIKFVTNGGNLLENRVISMKYGSDYCDSVNVDYKKHIASSYYNEPIVSKGSLPIPIKEGLDFAGWYHDSAFTQPVKEHEVINPNTTELMNKQMTLYAKWVDKKSPDIISDYLDKDWYNKPVTVRFEFTDNANGGISFVELRKLENETATVCKRLEVANKTFYEFEYTFGNVEQKLYEGITKWEIYSEDFSGNASSIELTLRLDYTPPLIYSDSMYDEGGEILYDDRDAVKVWCEDIHSGPGLLNINPSGVQNTFVNTKITPYVTETFVLDYEYYAPGEEYGYVLHASDKAGNEAVRVIITDKNIASHVKRVIPRENYD